MKTIGIIAGVDEELSAYAPELPRRTLSDGPLRIHRIDDHGKAVLLACAGVGKVAAATAAATLVTRYGAELLLVIGTAGKIDAVGVGPFNLVEAVQADYGAQRADGLIHYTAGRIPIGVAQVQAFEAYPGPDLGLPTARIATADLFIECPAHAGRVRERLSASLVDMETAAVAQAAGLLEVPWAAIKAATDGADADSAGDFHQNLAIAARAAAEAARRLVRSL